MLNLNTINLFLGVGVCSIWRHKFVCFRKQGRVSYIVQATLKDSLGTNLDYLFYLSHFQKWQLSQLKRSKQNKQKTHMPFILRPSLLCFVSTKYIRIMMPVLIIFILKDRGEKEILYLHINNNMLCFNSNCLFLLNIFKFLCLFIFRKLQCEYKSKSIDQYFQKSILDFQEVKKQVLQKIMLISTMTHLVNSIR